MGLVSKLSKRKARTNSSSESESDFDSEKEFQEQDSENDESQEYDEEDYSKEKEAQKDAEMEELEKEIENLRHGEQSILMNLKRHTDEDLVKGLAVTNQKAIWDKTLELRFLLQKVFSSSNKLPQDPVRALFCDSDEAVGKAYSDLIASSEKTLDCLMELEEALLEKNPSIDQLTDGIKKGVKQTDEPHKADIRNDKKWSRIQKLHSRVASYRDISIDKWQRKARVATGMAGVKGRLQAFNQSISEQVAAYMRDPSRTIKRMQIRKPLVGVFGAVPSASTNITGENTNEDGDPELLDDSEFYQQLLREFLESASSTAEFYAHKRKYVKKRKIVDRRASKSRKIRYHVHEKLVNFMAPEPMSLPDMAPVLFGNLFGLKSSRSTTVA